MGVFRSTYACTAALIVRRKQIMAEGGPDMFESTSAQLHRRRQSVDAPTLKALEEVSAQQARSKALLRLMDLVQKSKLDV